MSTIYRFIGGGPLNGKERIVLDGARTVEVPIPRENAPGFDRGVYEREMVFVWKGIPS